MNQKEILVALRKEAKSQGGIAVLANKTALSRESLYKILSEKGNPRWSTICSIISALQVEMTISFQ